MKLLVIGGGGREHALAWKLAHSPRVSKVLIAPGNAGTALEDGLGNVDITDYAQLVKFAKTEQIALTVVGPEAPLAAGVVDAFEAAGLKIFGPTQRAAQLESSKDFAKSFMKRHHIPSAEYQTFTAAQAAHQYIDQRGAPIVIEDYLDGEEASFIVMADGKHALPLATSQDHKRLKDGDEGPNTGGMGAYSPAPVVTPGIHAKVLREVIQPVVRGMEQEGIAYTGFLYAGLMTDPQGGIKVLELNCRMGA